MKVKENLEHILKELQDATFKIEEEQIENVLKLIAPDKKIFLTGKGRSGLAAKGFANRLMHLGFRRMSLEKFQHHIRKLEIY